MLGTPKLYQINKTFLIHNMDLSVRKEVYAIPPCKFVKMHPPVGAWLIYNYYSGYQLLCTYKLDILSFIARKGR